MPSFQCLRHACLDEDEDDCSKKDLKKILKPQKKIVEIVYTKKKKNLKIPKK
jgi:hypothetical protein